MNLDTDTITISAWIRRLGVQSDWAGVVFSRSGSTVAGLNFGNDHELRYHWNDGQWGWNSGLIVPDGQWVHVALVVEPTQATIYLNGEASVHTAGHGKEEFNGLTRIGRDRSGRSFKGDIDDVAIWNRALPPGQIAHLYEQGLAGRTFHSLPDTDGDGIPDEIDLDDDNDGMPDAWEKDHSLNPLVDDAGQDPDLDTQNNAYEYRVDTDPQSADSKQTFMVERAPGSDQLTIRFRTSADRRYTIQFTEDLAVQHWQNLGSPFTGDGSEMSVSDSGLGPQRYYRLRVELP
jgi:hypothetical protein